MGEMEISATSAMNAAAAVQPAVAPAHSEPRPAIPFPGPPRRSRVWMWVAGAVLLVIVAATVIAMRGRQQAAETRLSSIRTAVAEKRDLVRSIRLNGTVEATQSYVVAAPSQTGGGFSTLVITKLVKAGATVHKGDLLVEFDPQNQLNTALDRRADFKDLEEQIAHKKADQLAARAKDDSDLKQAEDSVKSWEFEVQRNEVVSRIDAEKNQESLEEARAKLAQLKDTFELKRKAARSEMRILEIQRDRARNAMVHAEDNAKKMTIVSPSDGVVVLNTIWKGSNMGEVQEGDEVRTGVPFLQVMNPSSMQVRAKVNQADVPLMAPGQAVTVHLDAYPDIALSGKVDHVAAIGSTSFFSTKVRSFVAVFSIQGASPRLMPDLSAAVDVEMNRTPGAVVIPRDAVATDHGHSVVLVKNGSSFTQRTVSLGGMSDDEVAVESGLNAGDVVIRNPESQKGSL